MGSEPYQTHWNASTVEIARAMIQAPESTFIGHVQLPGGTQRTVLYSNEPLNIAQKCWLAIKGFFARFKYGDSIVVQPHNFTDLSGGAILSPAKLKLVKDLFEKALLPESGVKEKEKALIRLAIERTVVRASLQQLTHPDKSTCIQDFIRTLNDLKVNVRGREQFTLEHLSENVGELRQLLHALHVPEVILDAISEVTDIDEAKTKLSHALEQYKEDERLNRFFSFVGGVVGQAVTAPLTTFLTHSAFSKEKNEDIQVRVPQNKRTADIQTMEDGSVTLELIQEPEFTGKVVHHLPPSLSAPGGEDELTDLFSMKIELRSCIRIQVNGLREFEFEVFPKEGHSSPRASRDLGRAHEALMAQGRQSITIQP